MSGRKIERSKSVDLTNAVSNYALLGVHITSRSLNASPSRLTPTSSGENTPRSILDLIRKKSLPKINPNLSTSVDSSPIDPTQVQFHEKIGSGGSADIFSGSVNGLILAIKSYRQPISESTEKEDDLMHEISILRGLNHPKIVRYIGFSVEKDYKLLMLLELYRGTVHGLIRSSTEISVLEILQQVAEGLVYLHAQNVIHRDIKSENIFYTSRLNRETMKKEFDIKIGDFDIAVKCIDHLKIEQVPNLGTLEFRAPEIIRASTAELVFYTDKVDVWAFGMLIFELIVKDIPYRSDFGINLNAIENAIISGIKPTIPKRKKKHRLIQDLYEKDLYESCLCVDPTTRPSSQQILDKLSNTMS